MLPDDAVSGGKAAVHGMDGTVAISGPEREVAVSGTCGMAGLAVVVAVGM